MPLPSRGEGNLTKHLIVSFRSRTNVCGYFDFMECFELIILKKKWYQKGILRSGYGNSNEKKEGMTSEISLFRHNLHGSISSGAYERLSGPGNREFEHKFPKKIQMPGRGARRGCPGGGGC